MSNFGTVKNISRKNSVKNVSRDAEKLYFLLYLKIINTNECILKKNIFFFMYTF